MMKIFTLFILLLLLPVSAWAEATKESVSYIECSWNGSEVTSSTKTATATVVTDQTTWSNGWYVVNSDTTINSRVTVTGHVHLILADGCKLTVTGGIQVQDDDNNPDTPSPNSLTIYAQSTDENTMGKLTAKGADYNAGIGGGYNGSGGEVTIHGGEVTATGGGNGGAGIGGYNGSGGTFSTGTDGHAFIIASSIQDQSNKGSWNGVLFEGYAGAVYGSPTLQTDATIPAGKTLTVGEDKTLTIGKGVTLTNNGTIIVYGELKGDVKGEGSIPITGITLDQTTLSLVKGETATATLQATIKPSIATDKDLTWSSSDSDVATVKNGEVTAVAVGKTDITVTTQDGGYTATCEVTVKQHTHSLTKTDYKAPTCTEDGNIEYWTCSVCGKYFSDEAGTTEISLDETVIYATGHHYVNGTCTECGEKDPDYRPDPISYYNIYVEDVCEGVDITTSKNVVREGNSISVYVEKDTANYTFDNFKVYYKRSYYGGWEELKEGTQPGEYPVNNIWTHIYIKAEGAEEKEDPTGIEQIEGVKVYTKDGSLYVQTPQREQVIIVSMSGAVVKNEEQIGLKQYHGLQPGIYIVRVGDRAYKLRLH